MILFEKCRQYGDEVWKNIEGYENKYQVSSRSRIRKIDYNVYLMSPCMNKAGHSTIAFYFNGKSKRFLIHKLVADTFKN